MTLKEATTLILSTSEAHIMLTEFARAAYNEKFKDIKTDWRSFHHYNDFEVLSVDKIKVLYGYGAGDYEYDDSFIIEI